MSNRGVILRLLIGIFAVSAALWGLNIRSAAVSAQAVRTTLADVDPSDVTEVEVSAPGYTVSVVRASSPARWFLSLPEGKAAADQSAVMKLVDSLAFSQVGDALTFDELRKNNLAPADFGLSPPEVSIGLVSSGKGKRAGVSLGYKTSSGSEVYAMAQGAMSVFTLPAAVASAVPKSVDGFRPLRLLPFEQSLVTALDVRVPDAAFVKLTRTAGSWQLKSSNSAPALPSAVTALVGALAGAEIQAYVDTGSPIPVSKLATYKIEPDKSLLVTVYGPGESMQIVFGDSVEGDSVYALVQNGGAVVKVPASLRAACAVPPESFRDTRLFPVAESQVDSFTVSSSDGVCILRREGDTWSLESPVVAPANQERVTAFIQRMLSLDSSATSSVPADAVTVKIGGVSAALPASLPSAETLASFHTRTMLSLAAQEIVKVTVSGQDSPTVIWPAVAGEPLPGAVTEALANLVAVSVVNLSASPEELERFGLAKPYRTVAIDLKSSDSIRRNLIVGATLADGSRYVMLSGAATVFTLSPSALAAFGI